MSWWTDYSPQLPFIVGAASSAWMAGLRTAKSKAMTRGARCIEAATCSGISTGLTEIVVLYLHWSPEWAIPIGVFCGYLGTEKLTSIFTKLFEKFISK